MADFLMPALGADMETGKLVQWLVQPGARVKAGDVVAVVETHKGAIDVECFLDGVIEDLAPLDVDLKVGAVLARVRGLGEAPGGAAAPVPAPAPAVATATARATSSATAPAAASSIAVAAPPAAARVPAAAAGAPARTPVSPAARRRAAELGIDPNVLRGSGGDGAVTLADIERAATRPVPEPSPPTRIAKTGFDPAQMRQAIAAAMARSKREIPHYYLGSTLDFTAATAWLAAYNQQREPADRLLAATLLLKATALALAAWPQFNGFHENGVFRPGTGIHVGWAIALRGGGLVAPAIHDADRLALPQLMLALRDLVQRARAGGLRSSELTDPTITVTSLGERGAESVLGVIYPPQVAILGFGRIVERPWVVDGRVLVRPLIAATLAADHRVSDGHLGGQLLAAIDHALQSPETL